MNQINFIFIQTEAINNPSVCPANSKMVNLVGMSDTAIRPVMQNQREHLEITLSVQGIIGSIIPWSVISSARHILTPVSIPYHLLKSKQKVSKLLLLYSRSRLLSESSTCFYFILRSSQTRGSADKRRSFHFRKKVRVDCWFREKELM